MNGKKMKSSELEALVQTLLAKLEIAGFLTEGSVINSSSIKIGMRMKSFVINVQKLGYNARYNPYGKSKKGYSRTSTPTWDQRVQFNDMVNQVLNDLNISANVTSGPFTIRKGLDNFDESDWEDQKPEYLWHNEARGFKITEMPVQLKIVA